jgi:hypothetical protein
MLKKVILTALCAGLMADAGVVRMEIKEQSEVLEGRSFGKTGGYERIAGKVYFAIDPKLPVNHMIADIDKAPRNDNGLVEFSSDIYVLKPRDPKNGNGAVIYEVSNRGRKGMLALLKV